MRLSEFQICSNVSSPVIQRAQELQNEPENVNDVEEKLRGGEDVLFWVHFDPLPADYHLRIDRQKHHEYQRHQASVDSVHYL